MADSYASLLVLDAWASASAAEIRAAKLSHLIDAIGHMKDLERALASTVGRLKDEIGDRLDADARTIDGEEYTLEIRRSSQTRLDTAAARGLISQSLGDQALQSVTVKTDITAQFYRKRGL